MLRKHESVAKAVDMFDEGLLRALSVLRNLPVARLIFLGYLGMYGHPHACKVLSNT